GLRRVRQALVAGPAVEPIRRGRLPDLLVAVAEHEALLERMRGETARRTRPTRHIGGTARESPAPGRRTSRGSEPGSRCCSRYSRRGRRPRRIPSVAKVRRELLLDAVRCRPGVPGRAEALEKVPPG